LSVNKTTHDHENILYLDLAVFRVENYSKARAAAQQ
jgi:hypothetical protein